MNPEQYIRYYNLEDGYWWFKGMRNIFLGQIERIFNGRKDLKILDIGCGTGRTMSEMRKFGYCVGMDMEPAALESCKNRNMYNLVCAQADKLPFESDSFDLVTLFSVIEHVEDDSMLVSEVYRVCKSGGLAMFSTSAFNFLWSGNDIVSRHKRRYSKKQMLRLINKHFDIQKITYTNFFLFPIVCLGVIFSNIKRRQSGHARDGFYKVPGFLNRLLALILKLESIIIIKHSLPLGVSLLCVAKKAGKD